MPTRATPEVTEAEVGARQWYHTLNLPGGLRTPGEYDMYKRIARVPLPASLAGKRCLDVGTHDGFWAFEMERRGAAEVVAIDLLDIEQLDWPEPRPNFDAGTRETIGERKEAFHIAHRALGSHVEHRNISVYELSVDAVGSFDFAVIGTLLLHLRDPAGALMAISRVLDGELLVNDVVSLSLSLLRPRTPAAKLMDVEGAPFWWVVNMAGLRRLVSAAGYSILASGGPYLVANGAGYRPAPLRLRRQYGSSLPRQLQLRMGAPHGWVLGRAPHHKPPLAG